MWDSSFKIPRSCLRPSSPPSKTVSYGTARISALILPVSHFNFATKINLKIIQKEYSTIEQMIVKDNGGKAIAWQSVRLTYQTKKKFKFSVCSLHFVLTWAVPMMIWYIRRRLGLHSSLLIFPNSSDWSIFTCDSQTHPFITVISCPSSICGSAVRSAEVCKSSTVWYSSPSKI